MQNRASQKTRQKYSVGPQKGSATNSAGADQTMYFSGPFLCTFYLTNTAGIRKKPFHNSGDRREKHMNNAGLYYLQSRIKYISIIVYVEVLVAVILVDVVILVHQIYLSQQVDVFQQLFRGQIGSHMMGFVE
jgi:hypothetical protein